MDGCGFMQEHEEWKNQTKVVKDEVPATWLMSKNCAIFELEGDLDFELERLREMGMPCRVFRNQTNTQMRERQNVCIMNRPKD